MRGRVREQLRERRWPDVRHRIERRERRVHAVRDDVVRGVRWQSDIDIELLERQLVRDAKHAARLRAIGSDRDVLGVAGIPALGDPHIGAALSTIHRSPESLWTVESLARKVGMSRSAFAAQFKQLVGEPPLQYLARWRMTSAAALLRDSRLGLREIAGRVGYDGEASFLRAFKRWRGQTPGEFRSSVEPRGPR